MPLPSLMLDFDKRRILLDPAQKMALQALQQLMDELLAFKAQRSNLVSKWLSRTPPPLGVYMWGSVGRGKTLMMDVFYQALPYRRKRRIHFHALMLELDEVYRRQPGEDPTALAVMEMSKLVRVLCIDELTITAISDAMMFARFLHHAIERGMVILTTSNVPPDQLYKDGLQRERFLPTIALLKNHIRVVHLDSPTDYRLQKIAGKTLWMVLNPHNSSTLILKQCPSLADFYHDLTQTHANPHSITLLGRPLNVIGAAESVLWVDFQSLCGDRRTLDDYQYLIITYHTFLVSDVPYFSNLHRDAARRFIWLIDVLYDARVVLIASSSLPITALFAKDINLPEIERTESRLIEMQSESYQSQGYRVTRWQGE